MTILALIAEFENDIRRERQLDGIAKAKERGVRFGVQPKLTETVVKQIRKLRRSETVPEIMRQMGLSKASVYRALSVGRPCSFERLSDDIYGDRLLGSRRSANRQYGE